MNRGFSAELRRVIFFTVLCFAFGLLNGYLTWTLIAGGAAYMSWMMWQIYQLDQFLQNSRHAIPPDASGIWGDIFDNIMRLQKRQRREKKQLQAVVRRGQETTTALRDGVLLLDRRGNIEWFNLAARQLLNLRSNDQGRPLVNYIRHPKFVRYFEKGDFQDPLDLPSPQSVYIRLQYQITRFGQGEYLIMIRDVTRLYKLEQMRKDFVANVSHELRTPLTVIRGYVETLSMSPDLPEPWVKALSQMEQQGLRMTTLINDLISLSKLETDTGEMDRHPVMVKPLLERIQADASSLSGGVHPISVECDEHLSMFGSEKELHSAFSNLAFNAVKYSPDGTAIKLVASVEPQGDLRIDVIDEGDGIDPIHIPRLTERFYRVDDSRHSSTGGTGLGLAIVKHVLMRHGGRLDIQSQLNRGSCFSCIFDATRIACDGTDEAEAI